eukprot:CAMPEP_0114234048 /NCGR_PEP_ID=MMETSP0058-20121206/5506_1 /TAXON_ID=36894 /ORGANISM="Pyramimonas parkeae, CCMP726" /LENGTH=89 /DNA_ID=CAMNT_0001345711 /DNA_START=360 /DNA_END=632 /DNA_ORIENTATION=+
MNDHPSPTACSLCASAGPDARVRTQHKPAMSRRAMAAVVQVWLKLNSESSAASGTKDAVQMSFAKHVTICAAAPWRTVGNTSYSCSGDA